MIAAGLVWLRFRPGSNWSKETNYKPWGGPVMAIIYSLVMLFLIISPWIHVDDVPWDKPYPYWMYPTIVCGLLVAGALYWVGFVYIWPKIYRRELQVQRIPILLDDVQVNEIITYAWVSSPSLGGEGTARLTDLLQVVPGLPPAEQIEITAPPNKTPAQSPPLPYSSQLPTSYSHGSPYSGGTSFSPPTRYPQSGDGRW